DREGELPARRVGVVGDHAPAHLVGAVFVNVKREDEVRAGRANGDGDRAGRTEYGGTSAERLDGLGEVQPELSGGGPQDSAIGRVGADEDRVSAGHRGER